MIISFQCYIAGIGNLASGDQIWLVSQMLHFTQWEKKKNLAEFLVCLTVWNRASNNKWSETSNLEIVQINKSLMN